MALEQEVGKAGGDGVTEGILSKSYLYFKFALSEGRGGEI